MTGSGWTALPPAWKDGRARGLKARGGVAVDMAWKNGRLSEAVLRPALDTEIEVMAENAAGILLDGKPVPAVQTEWGWKFAAKTGETYTLLLKE